MEKIFHVFPKPEGALQSSLKLFTHSKESPQKTVLNSSIDTKLTVHGDLKIENISCGTENKVLFVAESLMIKKGDCIAIVGPSGAGKSTLLKTIAGLYEPINWQANYAWDIIKKQTCMVAQSPYLFDDSIENNPLYGLSKENAEKVNLWEQLETVVIANEIKSFKEQLSTTIRPFSQNISGGQQQRLVIARTLLQNKNYLLLDEATSAVDSKMEAQLTQSLLTMVKKQKKVLISCTHRLSFLENYDQVWFVEHGRIVAQGPHLQLLNNDRYRSFYNAN